MVERGHGKALEKVLRLFLEVGGFSSDKEAVEHFRKNNGEGLHRILQGLISRLETMGYKPKSIHFSLYLLSDFLRWFDVDVDMARRKIKLPKKAVVRSDKLPTLGDLQRLILGTKSPRLRMLIQFLAQTGMRLSEAINCKLTYIGFENGWIKLPGIITKTGQPREIPLISELKEALKKYVEAEGISDYLFPSAESPNKPMNRHRFYERWYALLKRLKLDERDSVGFRLHPHTLRKWFKTRLEHAGVNRLLIELWLGHTIGVQGQLLPPTSRYDRGGEAEGGESPKNIRGYRGGEGRKGKEGATRDQGCGA